MLAYRMDPAQSVQSMAHGVDAKGRFLVSWIGNACCPVPESAEVNPVRTGAQPEPVPVRLEILRQSPDPMTRIAAASLHLLGSLYVLSDDERIDLLAERALPTMVGDVAGMRGAHVGVLVSDRVLLHDCYGVTPLSFDALVGESADAAPVFPTMADDLEAGDWRAVAQAMTTAHYSMRDDLEVSVPEVDLAVDTALAAGAWGARLVGGGFGGCVLAVMPRGRGDELLHAVSDAYDRAGYATPQGFVGEAGSPAARDL